MELKEMNEWSYNAQEYVSWYVNFHHEFNFGSEYLKDFAYVCGFKYFYDNLICDGFRYEISFWINKASTFHTPQKLQLRK